MMMMVMMVMVGFGSSISIQKPLHSLFHGSNSLAPPNRREFPHALRLKSPHPDLVGPRVLRGRRNLQIRASFGEDDRCPSRPWGSLGQKAVIAGSMVTVALAVSYCVMYKLALVPMKPYPFFLDQFTIFGCVVIIYFSILLALPKWRFVAIGMLVALEAAAGMSAGALLPGPAIPLVRQTFLVWQLGFSLILLGRKYSFNQIRGWLLVAAGVVIAVASGSDSSPMAFGINFIWPEVMIASSAFQVVASIIEAVDYKPELISSICEATWSSIWLSFLPQSSLPSP